MILRRPGRVGLNYLFDFGLSPYVSYSTSFTPNLGADLAGNSFKPTTGEGTEIGVKFKPNGSNFMLTAAAFDITQQDILTAIPSIRSSACRPMRCACAAFEFEAQGQYHP